MKGILIKIKDGHVIDGAGEGVGTDIHGESYTYWRSQGNIEVPLDLAIKLEQERPPRYEVVDQSIWDKIGIDLNKKEKVEEKEKIEEKIEEIKAPEEVITIKELNALPSKDSINDWAAKRDYDVNPSKQSRKKMIASLIEQIEERIGKKVV